MFHDWVADREMLFADLLSEGERFVGEWLAQAHGTRYKLDGRAPFCVFDLFSGTQRAPYDTLVARVDGALSSAPLLFKGGAISVERVLGILGREGFYGAQDPVEGAVWRVERKGHFDFLAKYVRPDKIDGSYLPEIAGGEAVWNWTP
jgi:hypothetical protein